MQTIDSGFCRTSSGAGRAGATQGFRGFHGSFQDRADQLVRATVLSDLGQSVGSGHGGHRVGIQGVAAAISKVLSAQDVTGTGAADDVLKKIETSLQKAAQALADRGVDAKTIDATIDRFRSQLASALDGMTQGGAGGAGTGSASGAGSSSTSGTGSSSAAGSVSTSGTGSSSGATAGTGSSVTSVSTFVAREVRKERGTIDLLTAEGDRVSIRFRTKEVTTGSVTQSTSSDGTSTTAAKASVFSRGGVKIEVDGDLNEDELAAIGDLLGKVDDIATQFFSGDVQAAFSAAGSLGVDSDQIAAYRLNLTYSRKVTAAYAYAGTSLPASSQPPASTGDGTTSTDSANGSSSLPASGSASSGSASTASGSLSSSASTPAPSNSSAGASPSTSTNSAADATDTPATGTSDASPATTPPASAQKTIIDFLNDTLSKLSSSNGAGRISFSMHWKMSVLVTAIQSVQPSQPTTAADQAAAANTQLLGDSLQKAASA